MPTDQPKRGRGRPRNAALDELQRELAVSRRHARTMLRDMKAGTSANSEKSTTPLAAARLQKLEKEIAYLEIRIRSAQLEQRALEGELLFASEARELLINALGPVTERLRTFPKTMSVRLVGQPQKHVEAALFAECNAILAAGRASVAAFMKKTGDGKEL